MNRAAHYKRQSNPRERDIEVFLKKETLGRVGFMAWFENQTRSRIVEAAIRFYFLRKKGVGNAYKKSKKNFKRARPFFIAPKSKQKTKKRGKGSKTFQ
ncbi:MAG: hypothetical protein ACTTH5_02955 [Wolinella sp.]